MKRDGQSARLLIRGKISGRSENPSSLAPVKSYQTKTCYGLILEKKGVFHKLS